ncbi:metallo-beta-lactamase type thioesterase nscB [Aspergillus mulundensis]|uniref:Lactamase-like protein aptB n=1 Tax=Aspergillus mulundensis TaxID=1810919 RepID=A0A3D8SWI2_9EURO|nr:Lactamase-like protein aptB [Aspergillus mulundensis]RDW90677.1 Lactamase-like protein aptB [Aspergillus mulundensis]
MAFRIPFPQDFWQEYLSGRENTIPNLPVVTDITKRVIRILGGNAGPMRLQGTNTYLVGTGRSRILVDTGQGMPSWIRDITKVLEERDIDVSHVLLTHWHGDHTGGVPDLIAYNPAFSTRIYKNRPDTGQKDILDGQVFRVEGATLRAVHTPGHAADHMCFLFEEENALFTGDNVLGHGYSVVEDLGQYMESMEQMANLKLPLGYPAHGAVIDDLPATMREYIKHREFRVQQVFAILEESRAAGQGRGRGGLTLHEIIFAMYGETSDEVEKALAPFLSQVLWKLAEDRKVGFEPGSAAKRRWYVSSRRPN